MILVSQQRDLGCRSDDWRIEVVGIREGNRNANAASFMEAARGRQQVEDQLKRFSGRDWH